MKTNATEDINFFFLYFQQNLNSLEYDFNPGTMELIKHRIVPWLIFSMIGLLAKLSQIRKFGMEKWLTLCSFS